VYFKKNLGSMAGKDPLFEAETRVNHGQPHALQPEAEAENQDQGQTDADDPHTEQADEHGVAGVVGPPQSARHDDGQGEEGLAEGHDAQDPCGQGDHFGIRREQGCQRVSQQEQGRGGGHTEEKTKHTGEGAVSAGILFVFCAHRLTHQSGGCRRNAVGRQIAQTFRRGGDVVGGQSGGADVGYDAGHGDLAQIDAGPLGDVGHTEADGGADDHTVGTQAVA